MQDEENKLLAMSVLYGILMTDDIHKAVEDYAREAVRLNQPQSEPIPFNLEAAKRGDVVVYGNDYLRWIGISQHHKGMNVLEGANGLTYAADCDLFMKPKPMRTAYVCVHRSGKLEIFDDANTAGQHGGQYGISIFEVQIPDLR